MSKISKLPFVSKGSDRPVSNCRHFLNEPDAEFWRDPETGVVTSVQIAWDRAVAQVRDEKQS